MSGYTVCQRINKLAYSNLRMYLGAWAMIRRKNTNWPNAAALSVAVMFLVGNAVHAADQTINGAGAAVTATSGTDRLIFGSDHTGTVADGINLAGALSGVSVVNNVGANSKGTLTFSGTSTVAGSVGATGAALFAINAGATGKAVIFSGDVTATSLTYSGDGTVSLNGNFTGTVAMGNGNTRILNVGAGKNIGTVNCTGTGGTVNFAGSTAIGGNLGNQGTCGLVAINLNGGTVTTGGNNLVATTVNINNSAVLQLTGTNTAGISNTYALNNSATLDLQNYNTVAWVSVTSVSGTTLKTTISSATPGAASHGYINLSGYGASSATLASGTNLVVSVTPGVTIASGTQYKIIDTGSASTYNVTISSGPRYSFTKVADANDLIIQASAGTGYVATSGISSSDPASAAATTLFPMTGTATGSTATLITYLDGLSAAVLATEVKKLAPTTSLPIIQTTSVAMNGALGTVSTRLAAMRGDTELAVGAMSGISAGDVSPSKEFWAKGFGGYGKQSRDNAFDGYKSEGLGLTFGFDREVGDSIRLGSAFSYADTKVDVLDARTGDWTKAKTYQLTVYGSKELGAAYVEASGAFGVHKFDTLRATPNSTTATGNFKGSQWTLRASGGLRMTYGSYNMIPMAGLTYSSLTRDAYTETGGGGAALAYNKLTTDRLRSDVGIRFASADNTASVRPEIHAAWLHDFSDQKVDTVAAFAGGGAAFSTPGQVLKKDALNFGGGLTFSPNRLTNITVTYDYEGRSGYSGHTGQVVGRWKF
jgi:outer membrane autotransporter protein